MHAVRRLVIAIACLCPLQVDAQDFESFSVPVVQVGDMLEIDGARMEFYWNTAASVPTVLFINPVDFDMRPVVLSRTHSEAEAEASFAGFIDAHTDWFRVSPGNLDCRAFYST